MTVMNISREDAKHMVGRGWSKIIDMLYDELPIPDKVRVYQVKEKLGTLRFYTSGTTTEEYNIIRKAEYISSITCEACGEPGEVRGKTWFVCLCEKCSGGKT